MIHFLNNSSEKPFSVFRKKYANALSARQDIIEAIAISSYSNEKNEVDSRFVNLKVVDGKDFIFFSNYLSPKAMQFQDHKQISALIHWSSTNTQIRMKANIKKTSISYNNNYFASRSEKKNALAISSSQSNFIKSYSEVEKNYIAALNSDNFILDDFLSVFISSSMSFLYPSSMSFLYSSLTSSSFFASAKSGLFFK